MFFLGYLHLKKSDFNGLETSYVPHTKKEQQRYDLTEVYLPILCSNRYIFKILYILIKIKLFLGQEQINLFSMLVSITV